MASLPTPLPSNKPVLYGYWRSSSAWRLRIAMNIKGVDYEQALDRSRLSKSHLKALNPNPNPVSRFLSTSPKGISMRSGILT